MREQVEIIQATPSKRIFLSIIADYDLNRAICELIDNALDIWIRNGKPRSLKIAVDIDKNQQTISVIDNAGGVKKAEISFIVGPGQTSSAETDETIGIFGVGTKRAVVALAQNIKIITRHGNEKTFQIEFDDSWLKDEKWELPLYEVDEVSAGSTIIELTRLRMVVDDETIGPLKEHLSATYAYFLKDNKIELICCGEKLGPHTFGDWAYPPNFEPHRYVGALKLPDLRPIEITVTAGLVLESSPAGGEYGVYFYCNNRLITRGLKTFEVGFTKGIAGKPHPSLSLARIIVSLNGEARAMPWNSSKSGINSNHQVFIALRNWLLKIIKDYTSLSRRLEGSWHEEVFKYRHGAISEIRIPDFTTERKTYLPPLPISKPRYADVVSTANRSVVKMKPWTKGLYEGVIAADLISKQNFEQKNRITLILLDSTLEIAFKEYLVNDSGTYYTDAQVSELFKFRNKVEQEIKKYIQIPLTTWRKINHYYTLRCKLIHERATVGISDYQIKDYTDVIREVLKQLYKLKF